MNSTTFVSTAIPYVNATPHLGFAYELILADVLARDRRRRGRDVYFVTGTDENSLKNVRAAADAGASTAAFIETNAASYRALRGPLNLSNDDFVRTSVDARHHAAVEKLWRACVARGDIYQKRYRGLYCVGCEQFYRERELQDGVCPEHRVEPEVIEEENWFFRLSRYQDALEAVLDSGTLQVEPAHHQRDLLRFIRGGLDDLSVSRSVARAGGWGLAVPDDPEQVIYVWFDALVNYIASLDYAGEGRSFNRYWSDCPERIHVIGRGVTRFHGVFWPAFLLSAGVPLPTHLFVHSYITVDGDKIGKSLGNAIDPVELTDEYGTDALRYFLLRHIRTAADGDFTRTRLVDAINGELADQLGNLVKRTRGLLDRLPPGTALPSPACVQDELQKQLATLDDRVRAALDQFRPHAALGAIWDVIAETNRYVSDTQPWRFARSGEYERLASVLSRIRAAILQVAAVLEPFLPTTSRAIEARLKPGAPGAILFPKI